jgi:hypothetical protein
MAPIISDCIRVSVKGTQPAGTWANVFHIIDLGASSSTEALAQSFVDIFANEMMTHVTAQWVLTSGDYVDLSSSAGDSGTVNRTGGPKAGEAGGFGAPPNTAVLIKWDAVGGRAQRGGRTYLGGVDEDQLQTNGDLTSGLVTNYEDDVELFLAALATADIALVINSKTGEATYAPRTITGFSIDPRVATQRRRLRS